MKTNKTKILLTSMLLTLLAIVSLTNTSCKKDELPCLKDTVIVTDVDTFITTNVVTHTTTNTVTHTTTNVVTATVVVTHTTTDTIVATALPLLGWWKLYRIDEYTTSTLYSTSTPVGYTVTYSPTEMIQTFNSPTESHYPATYGANYEYVEVDYGSTIGSKIYLPVATNNGQEYRVTTILNQASGAKRVWYLKK